MDACRRVMIVLIALLWTIGGIPTSSGDSNRDHTGGGDGSRALVFRRPEATLELPEAGPDDVPALPVGASVSVAARAAVTEAPAPSDTSERVFTSESVARSGRPRGPPLPA